MYTTYLFKSFSVSSFLNKSLTISQGLLYCQVHVYWYHACHTLSNHESDLHFTNNSLVSVGSYVKNDLSEACFV